MDRQAWPERFEHRALAACAAGLRRALGLLFRRIDYPAIGEADRAPQRAEVTDLRVPPPSPRGVSPEARACASSATARSSQARPSNACPELQFQRPGSEIELSATRRREDRRQGHARPSASARTEPPSSSARCVNRSSSTGVARVSRRARAEARDARRGSAREPERALVDRPDQGGCDHQRAARDVRLPDLGRAQGPRAHAARAAARTGAGPYGPPPADRRPREADPQESFYPATAVGFLYITAPIVSAFTALARLHQSSRGARAGTSPTTTSRARSPTSRSR